MIESSRIQAAIERVLEVDLENGASHWINATCRSNLGSHTQVLQLFQFSFDFIALPRYWFENLASDLQRTVTQIRLLDLLNDSSEYSAGEFQADCERLGIIPPVAFDPQRLCIIEGVFAKHGLARIIIRDKSPQDNITKLNDQCD